MNKKNAKTLMLFATLLIVIAFLVFLTRVIPLSPDEYFYSNASLSVFRALNYFISINSINTEHTSLLVLLSGLFISIFKTNNIYFLRLLIVGMSVATMYLYLQIFRQKFNKKESYWPLLFLLLMPGYFYASSKFYLEIPAAFGVALFALSLLKKKNYLVVGLALALILFTKEYYFLLLVPVAIVVLICDYFFSDMVWWKKALYIAGNAILVISPGIVLSLLLVDFNIGPYPRMLENSWKELMQSSFALLNKNLYFVVEPIARALKAANQQLFIAVDYFRGTPDHYANQMNDISRTASKIYSLNIGDSFFSKAIIESQIPNKDISLTNLNIFQKIWFIYKYNFSDQEFLTVGLGLTILGGITAFSTTIKNIIKKYSDYRFDFIMSMLALVFLFFNYQQAANGHGFRLNVPIAFVLIYFSYLGFKTIRDTKRIYVRISFVIIMSTLLFAYFYNESKFVFGSVLSTNLTIMTILQIKKYLFLMSYSGFALYLLFYYSVKIKHRELVLIMIIMAFFALKTFPFFLEKKAEIAEEGDDFNLTESSATLNTIFSNHDKIVTNVHCYKVYYYASWYKIPNDEIAPEFRTFPEKFPTLCYRYSPDDQAMLDNIGRDNFYILSVNEKNINFTNLKKFLDQNKDRISLVTERVNSRNETLWSIWKYSK